MALTNFAALTDEQKTVWSMDFWKKARNNSFIMKFTGTSQDSLCQRITELRKTEKGARAVITLVNDLEGDGRAGDRQLEGYEEALTSEDLVIQIDQLRHANRLKGRMADQRSVVNFREQSRDKLAYWISDRIDQLAFLTLAGIGYDQYTNGAPRVGSDLPLLEFANDVTAPSANRNFTMTGGSWVQAGPTSGVTPTDTLTWKSIVEMKAYAQENYIRPIRTQDGVVFYHLFVTPKGLAGLRMDNDFIQICRDAGVRGQSNPLFKGTDTVMVDGIAISAYRHVPNTTGLASGSKWGSAGDVEGQTAIFCGAQALAMADIGNATWDEEMFDYNNQVGISIAKIFGLLKPQFEGKDMSGRLTGQKEDFGTICLKTSVAQ